MMACIGASNVKYIGPDGKQVFASNERRPQTMGRLSKNRNRECFELMKNKGKDFVVPTKMPSNLKPEYYRYVKSMPQTLSKKERERLRIAALNMSVDERIDALAKEEEMTKRKNEQAERAKKHYKKIDDEKAKRAAEAVLKDEADEDLFGNAQKQKTMELAFIAKQEQEEEVRAVNRYILHSKCQAIRDIQIKEKRENERKQKEERIQLEKMVSAENSKALAKEDDSAAKRKERSAKYAEDIKQQMLQRETLRIMEAERKEEEGRIFREANAALQREEERLAQKVRERRIKFRAELDHIVEMSNIFKKMLCDQERETDRRIEQYMKDKRKREEELKKEKQIAKQSLEKKQQLLFELSKKLSSSKSNREELNILRERERAERDYRRREKESAIRRKMLEENIREARLRQMEESKNRQALQIAREEKDFKEMIASLKQAEEQEKKKEEERKKRRQIYCTEITKQMKDKAEIQRLLLESTQKESIIWRESERQRLANIRLVVGAKLSAMRDACLPETYIKDIERLMDRIIKRKKN